jgi:flagellar L-ring protein FlgH
MFCFTGTVSADDLLALEDFRSFTADKKAYRIGDTITILIIEQSKALSSADTSTEKSILFEGNAFDNINDEQAGLGIRNGSSGDAVTRRNGFLSGQITVAVTEKNVLGHLVVQGEQVIVVNGEEQSIRVKGTLRKEDIAKNNTVLSNRLTDARIEFTGQGDVSKAQKKGLIARILDWLGLI